MRAFDAGNDDTSVVVAGHTLAFELNVPGGVGHFRMMQITRSSQGVADSVSEADVAAEFARL